MTELETKEVLAEITNILNEVGPLPEEIVAPFMSRIQDILNHIDAIISGHRVEIDIIKYRIKKLERENTKKK